MDYIKFGTDGIRGVAGELLDAELAFKIGCAAATVLRSSQQAGKIGKVIRPKVMIAKDTRISGDMLESALASGLCSAGADVALLGVLPTPAVAFLTIKSDADMGVMISASHNSFEDNGIKFFGSDGYKLCDELESRIEDIINSGSGIAKMTHGNVGRITLDHQFRTDEYVRHLASSFRGQFCGRIAIDCANGAASETARLLFRKIGAEFEMFHDEPNGVNINVDCGSTHLEFLQDMMKTKRFDIGFAFDGDADRCLVVDELGQVVNGDMMLAVFARDMKASSCLVNDAFVGTVISNSGMDIFSRDNNLTFHRAAVGDRNVLQMMRDTGSNLGGESSGHILFSDDTTSGDGQFVAVMFLNALINSGKTVSELVHDIPSFPQVMPSFRLTGGAEEREMIMSHPKLHDLIARIGKELHGKGRVLIRPSGTEPIIRVMVEAKTEKLATKKANELLALMKSLS